MNQKPPMRVPGFFEKDTTPFMTESLQLPPLRIPGSTAEIIEDKKSSSSNPDSNVVESLNLLKYGPNAKFDTPISNPLGTPVLTAPASALTTQLQNLVGTVSPPPSHLSKDYQAVNPSITSIHHQVIHSNMNQSVNQHLNNMNHMNNIQKNSNPYPNFNHNPNLSQQHNPSPIKQFQNSNPAYANPHALKPIEEMNHSGAPPLPFEFTITPPAKKVPRKKPVVKAPAVFSTEKRKNSEQERRNRTKMGINKLRKLLPFEPTDPNEKDNLPKFVVIERIEEYVHSLLKRYDELQKENQRLVELTSREGKTQESKD